MSRSGITKAFDSAAASPKKVKTKRPAPFCLRLSDEERAYLKRKAGSRPLGAYVRSQLLDGKKIKQRKASRAPSVDHALLAQLLGMLGKSQQVSCLFLLALAEEKKRLTLPEEDSAALRQACADVREMRLLLITALGLKSGGGP